jgi:hypothetical protein
MRMKRKEDQDVSKATSSIEGIQQKGNMVGKVTTLAENHIP